MIPRVLWRLQWGVLFVSLLIYIIRFTYFWGARDLEFWKFCLADSLPLHTLRKGNDAIDVLSYADSTKKKEKRKGDRHTPPCQVENVSMLRETWAEAQGPSPCEAANDGIEVKRKVSLQEGNKLEVPRCLKIKASRNNRTRLTLDMMTSWTEHERRRRRGMRKATGDSTCHSLTQEAAPSEEPNEIQLPIARRTIDSFKVIHQVISVNVSSLLPSHFGYIPDRCVLSNRYFLSQPPARFAAQHFAHFPSYAAHKFHVH